MATNGDPTGAQPARQLTDDQRQAASIKVGISTYVATAALAVLAGALGLFTYISQTFAPPWTFYGLMLLTAAMLVISIVLGGDGQDKTVALVARGTWTNSASWQFNVQAVLTVLALLSLTAATAIGATAGKSVAPRASTDCVAYLVQLDHLADDEKPEGVVLATISRDPRTRECGLSRGLGGVLHLLAHR